MAALQDSPWFVVTPRVSRPRMRLFCFPYAGGSPSTYKHWGAKVPPDVEVVAVQPPGRGPRLLDPGHATMDGLVDDFLLAFTPYVDRPFAFFGHSLGARVGFEVARRLRHMDGPTPVRMILSGSRAPHIGGPERRLHDLPYDEFVEALREMKGTPENVLRNPELMEMFVPILRADFAISEAYRALPGEKLPCRAHVFGGRGDPGVRREDLVAWQEHFEQQITLHVYNGGHFFIETEPYPPLDTLGVILNQALESLE